MNGKKFTFKGIVEMKGEKLPFTKEIEAKSEKEAKERLYAYFGAKNGVKRSKIKIEEIA